jgi:4-hydroxy-tetrahydrodipicolinate reductase
LRHPGESALASPVKIAIAGALGRMGQAVAAAAASDPTVTIVARFDRPDLTAEGLVSVEQALAACDVVIDFTTPAASATLASLAAGRGVALVIGSTGLSAQETRRIDEAGQRVAIVRSGNFSLGVNMLMGLVAQAARALPAEAFDIEIVESHHRRKVDAPSGTALMLGEAAARGRGVSLAEVSKRGRDGITGARAAGEIGFAALRGGGVVGEHSVMFAAEGEVLTLTHSAINRDLFAGGALAAAKWAVGKSLGGRAPGVYDMQDVLGFGDR